MAGVFPSETTVYIVAAGTNGSALAVGDKVIGEITNWSLSGGAKELETIQVIGGTVDKVTPQESYEVSFDVIVANTVASTLDRWDIYKYGTTGSASGTASDRAIFITSLTNSIWKTFAFNNCKVVTWEPEMAADDMLKGTITFKLSPTTSLGVSNLKSSALASSVSYFNWA